MPRARIIYGAMRTLELHRLAGAVRQRDRRELVSWYVRLISAQVRMKMKSSPSPPTVTMPMYGQHLHAYRYWDLAFLVDEVFLDGTYDIGPLPDNPVIVDCGANIGVATFYFVHTYPGAQVIAFEPDPSSFAMLTENVRNLPAVTTYERLVG